MKSLTILLSIIAIVTSNNQIEFYRDLINDEIERISNFTLKTDNSEFWENENDNEIYDFGNYDFIIVGAGSAGSIVASRLSEIEHWKILVLEAGENENNFTDIPSMYTWSATSDRAWNFYTTPQTTSCLGMNNRQCYYPRGKCVGGSSVLNSMVHARGNRKDFDRWALVHGNPGWSYYEILPYFKKFEKTEIQAFEIEPEYHGYSGPININYIQPEHNLTKIYIHASQELGFDVTDYNGARQIGVSPNQKNLKNGRRQTSGRGYIDHAKNRENFKISIKSYVTKILINKLNQAFGVLFMKNGIKYQATALKEVIISAGSVSTPQLLMLSGIGPEKHLKDLGIKVIKNLPVGRNLHEHVAFGLSINSDFVDRTQTLEEQIDEYLNGFGGLTYQTTTTAGTFFNLDGFSGTVPELTHRFVPTSMSTSTQSASPTFTNYRNDILYSLYGDANAQTTFSMIVILLHPKSVGEIILKSRNPIDFPNINVNSLSDENDEDITKLYEGIQYTRKLFATEAFSEINASDKNVTLSECSDYEYDSKDYWFCLIRHLAVFGYHPVGTTRMGWNDRDYVVDNRLRVYGIRGLRVADAGIMPELISGNTQAGAFMIGEKAADLIKEDYL